MKKQRVHPALTMPTTTLVVTCPTDFTRLNTRYYLARYALPQWLQARAAADEQAPEAEKYTKQMHVNTKLHSDLRKSIHAPYTIHRSDMLSGSLTWAVYVLYPQDSPLQPLYLSGETSHHVIDGQEVAWEQAPLQILLKLLQIVYIHHATPGHFVGQDDCYIYAKTTQRKDGTLVDICVRVQFQGDLHNEEHQPQQVFYTTPRACPFRQDRYPRPGMKAYYRRKIVQGQVYYVQLQLTEVQQCMAQQIPVYAIVPFKQEKTTLPYLSLLNIEESTGTILFHFLHHYIAFLQSYGITCNLRYRTFRKWDGVDKELWELPVQLLGTIGIYDNRLQPRLVPPSHHVPFESYIALMRQIISKVYPELQVVPITDLSIAQQEQRAILLLQDYSEEDFQEHGLLAHLPDPYQIMYTQYPNLVKQSLNINTHIQEESQDQHAQRLTTHHATLHGSPTGQAARIHTYLTYLPPTTEDIDFCRKLRTCLIQLYLKDLIFHKRSVAERLPFYPEPALFLRKYRVYHKEYEVLLSLEQDTFQFLNLRTLRGKAEARRQLEAYGIDWTNIRLRLQQKYQASPEETENNDVAAYHAIATPQHFVEIEDVNERILYDAATIQHRQQALTKQRTIEELKLLPHYPQLQPKESREAMQLYRRFQSFDHQLDEFAKDHTHLSFQQLTQQEFMHTLGPILGEKRDEQGNYARRKLRGYYRRVEMLLSDKANELHLHQGIWYDATNQCYLIGSPQSINQGQDKPTLVRHFDIYQGKERFNPWTWLDTTSAQFVRFHQYTVYPYPFHLIDLYIEYVGRFQNLPDIF